MTVIGLFEAKTKLSELCDRVASKGETIIISRRGKPVAKIGPVQPNRASRTSVWDVRADYEKKHGGLSEDFELPAKEKQSWRNPLK